MVFTTPILRRPKNEISCWRAHQKTVALDAAGVIQIDPQVLHTSLLKLLGAYPTSSLCVSYFVKWCEPERKECCSKLQLVRLFKIAACRRLCSGEALKLETSRSRSAKGRERHSLGPGP